MEERVKRLISLIESSIESKTFDEGDLDLLITSVIMLIEDKIRRKKYDK